LEAVEALVGVIKVELGFMISEIIFDGVGDKASGDCQLKQLEASSAVVAEEGGEGGGTGIS
jgi:hypothetical protein